MPAICANCLHPPENHRPGGCVRMEVAHLDFRMVCDCPEPRFVAITELYPTAVFDAAGNFQGHRDSPCEHRTVGSHRAWCFQDSEWCYPSNGCASCTDTE